MVQSFEEKRQFKRVYYSLEEAAMSVLRPAEIHTSILFAAQLVNLELFGKNYLLLRHEDLISSPGETIRSLYDFMERPLPLHVIDWAGKHVRRNYPCYAPDHPRWREAFRRLTMEKELELAGYDDSVRKLGLEKDMELAGSGDSFNLGRLNRWLHGLRSKFRFRSHEDGLLLDD